MDEENFPRNLGKPLKEKRVKHTDNGLLEKIKE
jgi:hypothetical protein